MELVREANEAWERGDITAALRALDPLIEWHIAVDEPDASSHRSVEAVLSLLAGWAQSFDDFSIEILDLIDVGYRVVLPMIARGRPDGSEQTVEVPETQLYPVREARSSKSASIGQRLKHSKPWAVGVVDVGGQRGDRAAMAAGVWPRS